MLAEFNQMISCVALSRFGVRKGKFIINNNKIYIPILILPYSWAFPIDFEANAERPHRRLQSPPEHKLSADSCPFYRPQWWSIHATKEFSVRRCCTSWSRHFGRYSSFGPFLNTIDPPTKIVDYPRSVQWKINSLAKKNVTIIRWTMPCLHH